MRSRIWLARVAELAVQRLNDLLRPPVDELVQVPYNEGQGQAT
ncbi:hypothetical protein [Streptomyces sp. NBC_01483]|nr:hypothetical protein [Streptomyces sp. NBC_01483]